MKILSSILRDEEQAIKPETKQLVLDLTSIVQSGKIKAHTFLFIAIKEGSSGNTEEGAKWINLALANDPSLQERCDLIVNTWHEGDKIEVGFGAVSSN
ncbi:hypothetical protein MLD52_19980 [Puniceicoccaceae bacterium K14]|nr:hypothetical protein [Puniceicoccaceae bacterium K14]